jgi:RNA polymerase-binding transcription factor DksA
MSESTNLTEHLQQEIEETRTEIEWLNERLTRKGDYGLGTGDPSIYDWEVCLALRQRAEAKLESLKAALRKAEAGSYGVCERCGKPIDPARLEILPDTTRCIACASKP